VLNRVNTIDLDKTVRYSPLGIVDIVTEPLQKPRLSVLPAMAKHVEYDYNDFKRQPLLPQMLSRCGPALAKADRAVFCWKTTGKATFTT